MLLPVIVTNEYNEASSTVNQFGGRISWLENTNTDDGDWFQRDIGRYPGVNCVKGEKHPSTLEKPD